MARIVIQFDRECDVLAQELDTGKGSYRHIYARSS